MKENYCKFGKIECEHHRIIGSTPDICMIGKIVLTADVEICPCPSKQKLIPATKSPDYYAGAKDQVIEIMNVIAKVKRGYGYFFPNAFGDIQDAVHAATIKEEK